MHLQVRHVLTPKPLSTPKWMLLILPALPLLAFLGGLVALAMASLDRFKLDPKNLIWCDPNGEIRVQSGLDDSGFPRAFWPSRYALSVSLPVAEMQFSTAKTVDILWDLVVGRGLVVYYVFRKVILVRFDQEPIPLQTVISMQYDTTPVPALASYSKAIAWLPKKYESNSAVFSLVVLILSSIYVLALPTWLSAMTAYQSVSEPMIRTGDTLIPPSDLEFCTWYLPDAQRIDLAPCVHAQNQGDIDSSLRSYYYAYFYHIGPDESRNRTSFYWVPNSDSDEPIKLDPPLLNLTHTAYMYDGHLYDTTSIKDKDGVCTPQKRYTWGFSFMLLFAFLLVSFVVWMCVFGVWVHAITKADREQHMEVFGSLRTALEVGSILRDEIGDGARGMSNDDLETAARERRLGIMGSSKILSGKMAYRRQVSNVLQDV